MMTLQKEFVIQASPNRVWMALTQPEKIRQYFFGTNCVTDWKVGGSIFFRGEWEGKPYEDKGTVLAFDPYNEISYNYWSSFSGKPDVPENYATIRYLLRIQGDATILTIVQDRIETEELLKHSDSNWTMVIEGLRTMVESGQ